MRHQARHRGLVLLVALFGCLRASEEASIEINGNHSLQEKQQIAERLNTPVRIWRVRAAVKKRFLN